MKTMITIAMLVVSSLSLADTQENLFARALQRDLAETGMQISNIRMRTSFDFVAGMTAVAADAYAKYNEEFQKAGIDTDAKKVSFNTMMGRVKMKYNCNVVFVTGVENGKRDVTVRVVDCNSTSLN